MADWTTPKTWSVADILTAADMNTYVRDNTPIFYWKTTPKTVNTTNIETDLLNGEIMLAAGVLGANRRLILTAWGDLAYTSGATVDGPQFILRLGGTVGPPPTGTVILDTGHGATNLTPSANRGWWYARVEIQAMNSTAAQSTMIQGLYGPGTNANFDVGTGGMSQGRLFAGVASSTVDMTSARLLTFSILHGSSAAALETKLFGAKVAIGV